MDLHRINLKLFDGEGSPAGAVNTSSQPGLSAENKTYYDRELIRLSEPELIHRQFGQMRPIPRNGGKTVEFRQFDPLPEMTEPLEEGVTPNGQSMSVHTLLACLKQYGGFVDFTDVVDLTAIDPVVLEITRAIASQAGRSLDSVIREVLNAGTVVQYAQGQVDERHKLHYTSPSNNCNLTVEAVKKAVRFLKNQDAPTLGGSYVGIIHPDCTYDLKNDPEWQDPHKYVDTEHIYSGEIGRLYGVRFVENSRAKVFRGDDLASNSRALLVNGAASNATTVGFDGGSVAVNALKGRMVLIGDQLREVVSNTASTMVLKTAVTTSDNTPIYPGEGGAAGASVYATLILGADAYGVTEVEGGGLEHILKPLGSGGASDPLNQKGTVGWKALMTAELLVPQYLVRVETTATP